MLPIQQLQYIRLVPYISTILQRDDGYHIRFNFPANFVPDAALLDLYFKKKPPHQITKSMDNTPAVYGVMKSNEMGKYLLEAWKVCPHRWLRQKKSLVKVVNVK